MKKVKAYKVFNSDWTCNNFQYEVGKTYSMKEKPIMCEIGFHACIKVQDCFSYYSFDPDNKVAEVELSGIILGLDGEKQCAQKIKILKEISWTDMLILVNTGKGNTGYRNSGYSNSGNRNSGDSNSGYSNSGNRNSGDRNSGYSNSGYSNSGNSNSGNSNSGDSNSGYRNSGYSNSGNSNSGDRNSGHNNSGDRNSGNSNSGYSNSGYSNSGNSNSGDRNSGNSNSGDRNSGYNNSGNSNSGYRNSGNSNSGDRNSGNKNSGDSNSGHRNSGESNSGHRNSGYSNSGNRNSGDFNSTAPDIINCFNKPCKREEWDNAPKPGFIYKVEINIWMEWNDMSDTEKKANKDAFVTDGYLKVIDYKEAWKIAYDGASKEDIRLLKALPNFDAEVFEEITGIKIK